MKRENKRSESAEDALKKKFGDDAKPQHDERVTKKTYWDSLPIQDEDGNCLEPIEANPDVVSEDSGMFVGGTDAESAKRVREIIALIDVLPDRQKQAATLCWIEGKTQTETAKVMRLSRDAVNQLIIRARLNMAKAYRTKSGRSRP